jgi:2,5-dihydroxypyridine 5,6-dioxygenase
MSSENRDLRLKAAAKMFIQRAHVKEGESVVITADTDCDMELIDALFDAACDVNAIPIVAKIPGGDRMFREPPKSVAEAMKSADVVFPIKGFNPYTDVMREVLPRTRILGMVRPSADNLIKYMLDLDYELIDQVNDVLTELLENTTICRYTSTAGTDLTMEFGDRHIADDPGRVYKTADENYLPGACVCVAPLEDSWEGTLVYDALVWPPVGNLTGQVKLEIKGGVIQSIEGGEEAMRFKEWLESFDDLNMFRMCHIGIGNNPDYRELTGIKTFDERCYGIVGAGVGTNDIPVFEGTIRAKSHADGYMKCANVYIDGVPLIEKGRFVHPRLKGFSDAYFCMCD